MGAGLARARVFKSAGGVDSGMSDGPIRLSPGDATATEIIERLEAGDRVIVETELLGSVHEITLRFDGEVYYCDTPTTLHRHETAEGMRRCLDDQRYGSA
jgi:hypothetical protein